MTRSDRGTPDRRHRRYPIENENCFESLEIAHLGLPWQPTPELMLPSHCGAFKRLGTQAKQDTYPILSHQ